MWPSISRPAPEVALALKAALRSAGPERSPGLALSGKQRVAAVTRAKSFKNSRRSIWRPFLLSSLANRLQLAAAAALAVTFPQTKLMVTARSHPRRARNSGMLFAMLLDEFLQVVAGVRYVFPKGCYS